MKDESGKYARRHDREFKEDAVALVQRGRSITEVARGPGISLWSSSRWVKDAKSGQGFRDPKTLADESPRAARATTAPSAKRLPAPSARHPKKSIGHLAGRDACQRYAVMQKMARDCCLTELAEALDVSRNGFHAHEHKDRGRRRRRDVHLLAAIQPLLVASRRTYGSPRITRALRQA